MERITKINIRMFIPTDNNHFNFKSFYFSEEIRKIAYTNIKLTHTLKHLNFQNQVQIIINHPNANIHYIK